MLLMLALTSTPSWSQAPAPAQQRATTEIITAPEATTTPAGAPSMLKPSPETAGDGTAPRQRLVTVFGTEPCPKPTSADEIVVCARLPDSEIYRIPERLRMAEKRVSPFQTNRNLLLGDGTGGAGGSIGSCSVVGAGGMIGCDRRQIDAWAQDRANRMGTDEETPR
ncbi:hypothetical protein [Polymorphobacter fuscus]|uniref:Uncharacterized protein n=1 Tax=Sandarakinorhabdus fusca TaxID=1439888 RepID=A0A7C9KZB0_9SPHN|nr:hypothetical protein [Polymorphobacter fuscus]KAB7646540.1 hypothetical protein F9290_11025 [Polymorphobacter fuscus]MQT17788.1 hypothetical protein [Polymorphobacter fuscus]NJC09664.1 hypothetical protein [Polymorphobacter fuscus]